MAKNRSGPGGGGSAPAPGLPSIVQQAAAYATGTTVTVTLGSAPTPGNYLISVLGQFGEGEIPVTTGFRQLTQTQNILPTTRASSIAVAYFSRAVTTGDGTGWTFTVGDNVHIGAVALYEMTPYGQTQYADEGDTDGSGGAGIYGDFYSQKITANVDSIAICAGFAFSALTKPVTLDTALCLPSVSWPATADFELYDPTGVQYGAMTVSATSATVPSGDVTQAIFNYTEVGPTNPQTIGAVMLFPA